LSIICYDRAMRRGRILAIKWGMNPNSSSLGVDVTFLLVGATVLAAVTPVIGALLRWRRAVPVEPPAAPPAAPPAGSSHGEPA
jgi:hypothetical protein